ncbi:MAG: GDSL-type esterase/lipase family protein [Candidatus Sumerlaeota bacterium]|nr:GDSL-type esterase/lipase family protein [Candidatus Sumerlaeota bacterium]
MANEFRNEPADTPSAVKADLAPARRRKRILFALGALIAGLVLALAVFEGALRIFNPFALKERASWHFLVWEGLRRSDNPEKVWEHVPGYHRKLVGYWVGINSLGLRGEEIERRKPPGEWRLLALGDSMTFGMSGEQNDAFPAQLQDLLRARHPGRKIEAINAGVLAYTTLQEEALLKELLPAVQPDLVALWWVHNDVILTGSANPASQDQQMRDLLGWKPHTLLRRLLHLAYEAIPCTMAAVRAATIGRRQIDQSHFQFDPQANPEGWAANRAALIRIMELCKASQTDLIVYTFGRYEQIETICRERGVDYLTTVERAGREHEERYAISAYDPHFTREGNAAVARTIAEAVEQRPSFREAGAPIQRSGG